MAMSNTSPPEPSALTNLINTTSIAKTPRNALALQVQHDLQHRHEWTDLQLYTPNLRSRSPSRPQTNGDSSYQQNQQHQQQQRPISPIRKGAVSANSSNIPVPMLHGRPPKPLYIHPAVQSYMLKRNLKEPDVPVEAEWVLPVSLGEQWSIKRFAEVFDALPMREELDWVGTDDGGGKEKTGKRKGRGEADIEVVASTAKTSDKSEKYRDAKRVLLAMLAHEGMGGDGTITYYVIQEGNVKPRQN